jgi:hypothetical protein
VRGSNFTGARSSCKLVAKEEAETMFPSNPSAGHPLDAFEQDLLRAARARTAPSAARAQAVRVALATSAAPSGPPARTGSPQPVTGAAGLAKVAGFAGVGVASVVGALLVAGGLRHGSPTAIPPLASPAVVAPSAPHAEPGTAPAASAPPFAIAPVWTVEDLPVAPAPSATHGAVSARPAQPEEPSLSLEIALLDRARAATASGEPARGLRLLDEYRTRFPAGVMASEAAVLRIEATGATGDVAAARRLAKAFLAAHPQNPYAARIASVVGKDL